MTPLAAPILAQSDSAKLGAGAVSIVVLLLMGVATALLVYNMNGRLKRLPSSFPEPRCTDDAEPADAQAGGVPDKADDDVSAPQPSTGPAPGISQGPGSTA